MFSSEEGFERYQNEEEPGAAKMDNHEAEENVEGKPEALFLNHYFKNLNEDVIDTFKRAYAISVIGKNGRVSTERFLVALPDEFREVMQQIASESEYYVDLDTPRQVGEVDPDWQQKILFSNCVENALITSLTGSRKGLHDFLKILTSTAVAFQGWDGEGSFDSRFETNTNHNYGRE